MSAPTPTPGPCGCRVSCRLVPDPNDPGENTHTHGIQYCPLHTAAADLLAALRDALAHSTTNMREPYWAPGARAAIARAEGRGVAP